MDFSMFAPVRVVGGEQCVRNNPRIFKQMGNRALIITGAASAKKSGALDDVVFVLDAQKIAYQVFDEVRENPLLSVAAKAGRTAKAYKADYIIAIGGGSVLDAARAASVFAAHDFEQEEDIYKGAYASSLPLVCIGTTAGTGSEVDNIAVLTHDATGQKKAIKKDVLFAKYAFADFRYTKTLSMAQTVSTALDALCHCFESWFQPEVTEPVVCAARRGAELIYPWLKEIAAERFDPGNDEMRRDLYYGSLWGGIAIAHAGTGFPHPAGYALTERGGVPHGISCAIFEPAFLQHSFVYLGQNTKKMLASIDNIDDICGIITRLCSHSYTLSESMCQQIATRAGQSANMQKTLGGYSEQELLALAKRLLWKEGQTEEIVGQWTFSE